MKVDLYSQTGEKSGSLDLPAAYFEAKVNEGLIHDMLRLQHANARLGIAKKKNKGERRGSGKKIRPQKGSGRSRQGIARNPHMRKGGRIGAPTGEQNFSIEMPKKQRRAALFGSLSERAKDEAIFALDGYDAKEIKTKDFAGLVKKLPIERNVLFVIPEKNKILEKSARNLPNAKTILVNYLNVADILKYRKICFMKDSVAKMETIWGSKQ